MIERREVVRHLQELGFNREIDDKLVDEFMLELNACPLVSQARAQPEAAELEAEAPSRVRITREDVVQQLMEMGHADTPDDVINELLIDLN